jgi:hypothetical protein
MAMSKCETTIKSLLLMAVSYLCGCFAQTCSTPDFMAAPDIVATCCESVDGGCIEACPATCSHTCAELIVPWIDQCGSMMSAVPDETFPSFKVSKLPVFSDACRQTLILFERGSGSMCTSEGEAGQILKGRVEAVNSACCEQNNINVCTAGTPQSCGAGMWHWHCLSLQCLNVYLCIWQMASAHSFHIRFCV